MSMSFARHFGPPGAGVAGRGRRSTDWERSEILKIRVYFPQMRLRDFKTYYLGYVLGHLHADSHRRPATSALWSRCLTTSRAACAAAPASRSRLRQPPCCLSQLTYPPSSCLSFGRIPIEFASAGLRAWLGSVPEGPNVKKKAGPGKGRPCAITITPTGSSAAAPHPGAGRPRLRLQGARCRIGCRALP